MKFAHQKDIIPPLEGWVPNTYYEVEMCFNSANPIHKSILYSGSLSAKREPYHDAIIFNPTYSENCVKLREVFHLKAIKEIPFDNVVKD